MITTKLKFAILPIIIILMQSCSNYDSVLSLSNQNFTDIDFISDLDKSKNLEELYTHFSLLKLESTEDCYIRSIDKISLYNNEYYVFDQKQSMIFVFHTNGKYQRTIGERGLGGAMYREINDFNLDTIREKVLIHCDYDNVLMEFNLDGSFAQKHILKFNAERFNLLPDEKIIFYLGLNNLDTHTLIITDLNGEIISKLNENPLNGPEISFSHIGGFTQSTSGVLFNKFGSSQYYRYSDSIYKTYTIKVDENTWPKSKANELQNYMENVMRSELSVVWNTSIENSNAFLMQYESGKEIKKGIYLKDSKKIYTEDNLVQNIHALLFKYLNIPKGFDSTQNFISDFPIQRIYWLKKNKPEFIEELATDYPEFYNLINSAVESDNPILITYNIK